MSQIVTQSRNFPTARATGLSALQAIYELTFERAEYVTLKSDRHVGKKRANWKLQRMISHHESHDQDRPRA